jgi:hypothetical protein
LPPEISRVTLGRGVAASVPEAARGRISNREDEEASRQVDAQPSWQNAEFSRPPHPPKFDRLSYQRDYMRDWRKAKPLGLTVSQYREQLGAKRDE